MINQKELTCWPIAGKIQSTCNVYFQRWKAMYLENTVYHMRYSVTCEYSILGELQYNLLDGLQRIGELQYSTQG